MSDLQIAPIAITLGDPAGIGPEIVAKLFSQPQGLPRSIVLGDAGVIERTISALGLNLAVNIIYAPEQASCTANVIDVIQPGEALPSDLPIGRVDARCGQAAFDAIVLAIKLARSGSLRAICTAPINKEAMHAAGINYPGHTEIL